MNTYAIAETFTSIQGEGMFTGTPMFFIRTVGCSVGKKICQHCDTDFDKVYNWRGGGEYTIQELYDKAGSIAHVCFTGGEPFDQLQFLTEWMAKYKYLYTHHVETSGTVILPDALLHNFEHICVSPKPGWKDEMIDAAHEVKVIVGGLGNGDGWPTLQDALRWAASGKVVYVQPRNGKLTVDYDALAMAQDIVAKHPQLRLSLQLHKVLKVR